MLSAYCTNDESPQTHFSLCDIKSVGASIQFTDYLDCTALTNRLHSKADIGKSKLYTKSVKTLCGRFLHNTNADCSQKVFCWCVVTSQLPRSRKIAKGFSPHTLSQCRVRRDTFSLVWCQLCWTPKLLAMLPTWVGLPNSLRYMNFELFCVQLRHLKIVTRTPARYIALTACAITEGLSQSTQRMEIACGLSLQILYQCQAAQTNFCWCDVKSVEAPNYLPTVPPGGPAMKYQRNISRSRSAFSWSILEMREQLRLNTVCVCVRACMCVWHHHCWKSQLIRQT